MKNIERYFTAAEYIHQNVTHIVTSDIINLAIVYDFMSYAALTIRDTISSGGTVVQHENSMKFALSQYEESPTHSHHGQFHRAFRAIVDNIKTAPPPPDMQKMIPTQSPIVFSQMSAPQLEDLLSETPLSHLHAIIVTRSMKTMRATQEKKHPLQIASKENASKTSLRNLMVTSNFATLSVLRHHRSRKLEMIKTFNVICIIQTPPFSREETS